MIKHFPLQALVAATIILKCFCLHAADASTAQEVITQDVTIGDNDLAKSSELPNVTPDDPFQVSPYPDSISIDNTTPEVLPNQDEQEAAADAEVIAIATEDLWQRIKKGYGMPTSKSSLVANHENFFSARPDYVQRMVARSQKYLFHIVEEVEKRGMPTEIALLPMIESAYNPQANSRSRASGIWQFMPDTGRYFGLKQNWWVDNRRNVTIATDAALTYLQKLHGLFGSWDLALAAYNAGEGTVGRAIEQNRKLGLSTRYEALSLPVETKNYVPKLQAMKNLMTNPGKYGLQIQTIANTAYFTRVSAPAQIDAHLAASLAEISDAEFLALNPSYNRPVITSHEKIHELLLPIASAQTFRNNLAAYNKPLVTWRTYAAKRGERVDNIASKFGVSSDQLRNANNLPAHEKLAKATTILVPSANAASYKPTAPTSPIQNTAVAENSVGNVDVSAEQSSGNIDLAHAEKQSTVEADEAANSQEKSQKIEPQKTTVVTHTIKKNETLQSIARLYDVSVKQILAANTLKSTKVKVGQTLIIKKVTEAENKHSNFNNKIASGKSRNKTKLSLKAKSGVKSKAKQSKVKKEKTPQQKSKSKKIKKK